jgi:nucleotide-binding universal stress UspA family protein
VLLHVMEGPHIMAPAVDDLGAQRKKMKAYLEDLAEPIRASGIQVRTEVLMSGDPAESIIDYLKDHPTQLVVMATRGKSRLNRAIFGSLTESVIHMVKVTPLLLVGGED